MREQAVLKSVENDRSITEEQDAEFFDLMQKAVLLALKEAGKLNEMQYRYAEEKRKAQRRETCRKMAFPISTQLNDP